MQNCVGAVMPILEFNGLDVTPDFVNLDANLAFDCADNSVLSFCQALSADILKDKQARQFPDVVTFGYFCRNANIKKVLQKMQNIENRRGWGLVVHIASSNIPVNFAFSFLMGFLTGNVNYVRVPSTFFPQIDIIVAAIDRVIKQKSFAKLARRMFFFRCERDSKILVQLVHKCDGLVVWGGDETVEKFQSLKKKPRVVELHFPNRVSSLLMDAKAVANCDAVVFAKLLNDFFNDTFLVHQNACSSPNVVYWLGEPKTIARAQERFWSNFETALHDKTVSQLGMAIEKRLDLLRMIQSFDRSLKVKEYGPHIWLLEGEYLSMERLRFGNFLQINIQNSSQLAHYIRPNEQTLTYFGVAPMDLYKEVLANGKSVDRIVPVGKALAIGMHWDGKNVLNLLSREIEII